MPKKKHTNSTKPGSSYSPSEEQALPSPMPPSGADQFGFPQTMPSVGGSGMQKVSQKPKSPKTKKEAMDRFEEAVKKAIDLARRDINQKMALHVLKDRVREQLNADYSDRLTPDAIEKIASSASRDARYTFAQWDTMPDFVGMDSQHYPTSLKHAHTDIESDDFD